MKPKEVSPLVVLFLLAGVVGAMCPSQCSCTQDVRIIDCQNKNMKGVPNFLNPSLQSLDMSDNSIQKLDNGLDFYVELKSLNLSRNQFQSLGRNQFMNQVNLVVLDISWNLISKVREGAFNGLESLEKLDLSSNLIMRLKKRVFTGLVNLQKLDLSNCKLSNIEPEAFKYLRKLEFLDMSKNQLRMVSEWTVPLIGLEKLDLSQNVLQQLSQDSFQIPSLRELNLADNLLSEINPTIFSRALLLKKLDISYNNVDIVPAISGISHLIISGTRIKRIDQPSFQGMQSLEVLEANDMLELEVIQDFSLMDCIKLSKVSLSSNPKLQPLPPSLFKTTPSLTHLDLSHNSWQYLSPDLLPLNLQTLRLSGLPLSCNCSLLWLWELTHTSNVVQGASCGNNTSLQAIDVDLLACNHQNDHVIFGITAGIIGILIIIFITLAVFKYIRSRINEKSQFDKLNYDTIDPSQAYSTYLQKKDGHLLNNQLIPGSPQIYYSDQISQASISPQTSERSGRSHKSPLLYSDRRIEDFYSDHQATIPSEPIYYSVQDVPKCETCIKIGGQCPAHSTSSSPFHLVSNLDSISPSHSQQFKPLYGQTEKNNSGTQQSFPDVLPPPRNQLLNYYV